MQPSEGFTSATPKRDSPKEPEWAYARIPLTVIADSQLSRLDIMVYAAISSPVFQGNVANIGSRRIAEIARTTQRMVLKSIRKLVDAGHLAIAESKGKGYRSMYILTSPVFGQKQGKVNVVRSTPRGKRLVSVEKIA